ncbi:MAG: hypothetical protein IV100_33080 [Myxococcales bacterium]|nr:hypothetical protein [Myxococcales bacterium]
MAEQAGLRSTLDNLRHLHVHDGDAPKAAPPPAKSNSDSLLASLLNETSEEANRELQELQAKLRDKRQAEEDAKRKEEEGRRKVLDALREQEARRREDKILEREAANKPSQAQPVATFTPAPVTAAPKKSGAMAWAIATVAILGAGGAGYGWWASQKAADEAKAAAAAAAKVPVAAPVAVAPKPVPLPPPITIVKAPPTDARDPEWNEAGRATDRRPIEVAFVAPVVEVVKTSGSKGTGKRPTGDGGSTGGGGKGPRIKINALDLGGSK